MNGIDNLDSTIALMGVGFAMCGCPQDEYSTLAFQSSLDEIHKMEIKERHQVCSKKFHTEEYNGHSYIVYDGNSAGKTSILHDPDCPCQKKGETK